MTTQISHLKDKDDNTIGVKVVTRKEEFVTPVIDVRISNDKRRRAAAFVKDANTTRGSKFLKPSYSLWGYKY